MINKLVSKAASSPLEFALAAGLVLGVVYFVGRKAVVDATAAATGIVSGDNALTVGTPYESKGVVGTIAAAANSASGGHLRSIGESLGGWIYDVTHRDYDPSSGLETGAKTVANGARATDQLWGPIGSVDLRHSW